MRWLFIVIGLAACTDSTGPRCAEESEHVDITGGKIGEKLAMIRVEQLLDDGFRCVGYPIRSDTGRVTGTRYFCTRCL
jgi:hypothetical protein